MYSTELQFSKKNILSSISKTINVIGSRHEFMVGDESGVPVRSLPESVAYGQWSALMFVFDSISSGAWGTLPDGNRFTRAGLVHDLELEAVRFVEKFGLNRDTLADPHNITFSEGSISSAIRFGRFLVFQRMLNLLRRNRYCEEYLVDPRYRVSRCAVETANHFKAFSLSPGLLTEVRELVEFCTSQSPTKRTHYHRLDEWSKPIYSVIVTRLEQHGFINGGKDESQNPAALFWWSIYGLVSSITSSPNLFTCVSRHHASAYERNEALKAELINVCELANVTN